MAGDVELERAHLQRELDGARARVAELEQQTAHQRCVEQALQRERDFISAVLETAGALVIVLDRDGRIIRFNAACEAASGYRFQEVHNQSLWALGLLLPEETEGVHRAFDALRTGNFPIVHENHWLGRDGRRRLINWSATALMDGQGQVEHIIATGIDVTERRQAVAALQDSESRLRCVLDTVVDGIITIDERGAIQSANVAAQRIFGYASEELLGRNVSMLMPAPHRDEHDQYLSRHIQTGEARIIGRIRELVGQRKDGSTFPMDFAVGETSMGDRLLFTGVVRDITERKCTELELRRAHDELERRVVERTAELKAANEQLQQEMRERLRIERELRDREAELAHISRIYTIGEMATTLAHELNQPLAAINNYAHGCVRRLRSGRGSADDLNHALEQIADEATRAGEVIRSIRQFVSKRTPESQPANVNDVVNEAARLMEPLLRRAEAMIQLSLADQLPPVTANRIQIEQVVLNLLRNGLEAMEQTPPENRVLTVRTALNGANTVEVSVADRGVGLAVEVLEQAFEPFFTTKPQGMGIGLSISRSIIQGHGGRLWAESRPGAGATFRFALPIGERIPDD